ncbi:MAG: hypothetical protein II852_17715 [Bacteroidales bacterium]|nr:hypothetical protein [Bacteroidales bacterium]
MAKKQENEKDIIVRMVQKYREWYYERFTVPVQYSSNNAYVVEYNTMKGIYNMLVGTYRSKYPTVIPGDEIVLGMWERMLSYLKEKKNYYFTNLLSIHRSYNTITAMLMRHNQKQKQAAGAKLGEKQQQKLDFLNQMLNNGNKQ